MTKVPRYVFIGRSISSAYSPWFKYKCGFLCVVRCLLFIRLFHQSLSLKYTSAPPLLPCILLFIIFLSPSLLFSPLFLYTTLLSFIYNCNYLLNDGQLPSHQTTELAKKAKIGCWEARKYSGPPFLNFERPLTLTVPTPTSRRWDAIVHRYALLCISPLLSSTARPG